MRTVDAARLYAAPDALRALGYTLDDPSEMISIRTLAEAATSNATRDIERLQELGDLVQSWRQPGAPYLKGFRERGVHAIVDALHAGALGLCGHNVIALSALWRSLGEEFREVRFRDQHTDDWRAGHYGIEAYLRDEHRWVYYDTEYNGYAEATDGTPLSLLELDTRLARGESVRIVNSGRSPHWDATQLLSLMRANPLRIYSVRNRLCDFDPERRFGALNVARRWLERLRPRCDHRGCGAALPRGGSASARGPDGAPRPGHGIGALAAPA